MRRLVLLAVMLASCEKFVATDGREFSSNAAQSTAATPLKLALIASGAKDLECSERAVDVTSAQPPLTVEGCSKRATYTLSSGHLKLVNVVDTERPSESPEAIQRGTWR